MPDCLASLRGSVVETATPFRDANLDLAALALIRERQIERGTAALVVCGSTGEAPPLSPAEQAQAIQVAVEAAGGRVPVIAGCSAASTDAAVVLAAAAGAAERTAAVCVAALRETNPRLVVRAHPSRGAGRQPNHHAF
jgi:4-hydroxy-tetrahydrodipicolinate synthase